MPLDRSVATNLLKRFGPNLLETRDFQIGLRGFEERKRSKRCTKCCPVLGGHFHYKTGEKTAIFEQICGYRSV